MPRTIAAHTSGASGGSSTKAFDVPQNQIQKTDYKIIELEIRYNVRFSGCLFKLDSTVGGENEGIRRTNVYRGFIETISHG